MMVPHELHQNILFEKNDVPTAGHVGINRIMDAIKRNYWWRGIWGDVTAYMRSCPVCQRMKSDNQKKAGELQPIPLLGRAWQQITIDLVTDLPESEGKTAIAMFIDRLTKLTMYQGSVRVPIYPVVCRQRILATWNVRGDNL